MVSELIRDDSVDILPFILRVLKRWRLIAVLSIPVPVIIAVSLFATTLQPTKSISQIIRFYGIVDGSYPNGTAFTSQDLYTPEVLGRLAQKVEIPELSVAEYYELFEMQPYGVNLKLLEAIHQGEVDQVKDNKEHSQADLEKINSDFLSRVESENKNLWRLTLEHERLGLSEEAAARVLAAWPKAWEEEMVGNFRVLSDLGLRGSTLIDGGDLSIPENAYYANEQLSHVVAGLGRMSNDVRFRKLQSEKGRTPDELLISIAEYRKVFFQPLYSSVLSIDSPLSEFYLQDQELEIARLEKEISSLQSVVDDVLSVDVRTQASPGPKADGDIITIGDGTLNDIVGLVQKASMQDFLTGTLNKRHGLEVQKSQVEKSLAQVQGNRLLSPEFVATVSGIHDDILKEYNDLLRSAEERVNQSYLSFYKPMGPAFTEGDSLIHPLMSRIVPVSWALCVFLLCSIQLVRPRPEEEQANG